MINIKGIEMELKDCVEQEIISIQLHVDINRPCKNNAMRMQYRIWSVRLGQLQDVLKWIGETSRAELEHCVKMAIGAGISTGHAGTITELVEELMLNVVEALKSPWVLVSDLPKDGQNVFVRLTFPEGPEVFYWALFEDNGWTENFDGEVIPSEWITHWQPISEIPAD